MSKKAKTPKAPDYTALANQQAKLAKENWKESVVAARPDQFGPEGGRTWEQDPTSGEWTERISMAPERQEIWNTLQGKTLEQLKGFNTGQVDFAGAPEMPTVGGYNQQAIDTIRALQAPQLERARAAKEARLAAMGLGTGSGAAWDAEQQNLSDAEGRADLNAVLAGIEQGNKMFGQGMGLRQQGVGEILQQQQANQAKMSGLMGLGNQFRLPQFDNAPTPGMPGNVTPDLMGAAQANYQAAVAKANAKNASRGGLLGTVAGIAGNALGGPIGGMIGNTVGNWIGGGGGGGGGDALWMPSSGGYTAPTW